MLKNINEKPIRVIGVYSMMMVSNKGRKWFVRLTPVLANLVHWGISCTVKVFYLHRNIFLYKL